MAWLPSYAMSYDLMVAIVARTLLRYVMGRPLQTNASSHVLLTSGCLDTCTSASNSYAVIYLHLNVCTCYRMRST